MSRRHTLARQVGTTALLLGLGLLAGCGGAPGEEDIRQAMQANVDETIAQANSLTSVFTGKSQNAFVESLRQEVLSVKKHKCAADESFPNRYTCQITASIRMGKNTREDDLTVLMRKGDKGWQQVDQ